MPVYIGPYSRDRVVLCSGDAGPRSQRRRPCEASYFFPRAKWVGAVRNAANRLECRFVILTTGHGMVDPETVIEPYDVHISHDPRRVSDNWRSTALKLLGGNQCDILVLYRGGCPDSYVDMLQPILRSINVSLLTFGRPNMNDIGHLDELTECIIKSTTYAELKSILFWPSRLEYYPTR